MYGRDAFAVRMEDDSMAPQVRAGEWIYIDPDEPARPGRLIGVCDPETGERTCRLMVEAEGQTTLQALDAAWPHIVLTRENETMILGTVTFVGGGV